MGRFVPLLLGFHLWLQLVLLPAAGLGQGAASAGQLVVLLLPLLPLLWGLRCRSSPAWLLGVFPVALLAPLLLERPLAGERELSAPLALLLAASLIAYLLAAGWRTAHRPAFVAALALTPAPDPAALPAPAPGGRRGGSGLLPGATRLRLALLVAALPVLLYAGSFRPGLMDDLRRAFPEHLPEARVGLGLAAFLVWLLLSGATVGLLLRRSAGEGRAPVGWQAAGLLLQLGGLALAYLALGSFSQAKLASGLLAVVLALLLDRWSRQACCAAPRLPGRAGRSSEPEERVEHEHPAVSPSLDAAAGAP